MNLLKTFFGIGGMTTLSRILGFIRDTVIARFFGAGLESDAFFVAFKIPNLLSVRSITHDQLRWLFDGLDIDKITGFKSLKYTAFY